jgi:hypothetical protein
MKKPPEGGFLAIRQRASRCDDRRLVRSLVASEAETSEAEQQHQPGRWLGYRAAEHEVRSENARFNEAVNGGCSLDRRRAMLDFIERYFRVSPDSGDGTLEYFLFWGLLIILLAIAVAVLSRFWPLR